MKDITIWTAPQEKNNKTPKNVFAKSACRVGRLSSGEVLRQSPVHHFRQSDILISMSPSVHALEQVHAQIRTAIIHRQPIVALYRGRRRLLCPHLLGWNRHRRLQVLCYQYGGDSESGLMPTAPADNWRCLAVENLSQVELLDGLWQTAENHSRLQTCIDEVELDVDDYPGPIPPLKSAKL